MPIVDVLNIKNETVGQVELADLIFNAEMKPHLVHEVVKAQLASRRAGTACTKDRGEVAFSTRKPFRQKGTGRARGGSRKSPVWRHGGTIFGPKPRDYAWRPNAKVRRQALRVVLTSKLQEKKLIVLDNFDLPEAKTKLVAGALKTLGVEKALVVIPKNDETLERAARNLPNCQVQLFMGLNCYDLLRYTTLVILKDSLDLIQMKVLR